MTVTAQHVERRGPWSRCSALLYEPFLAAGERAGMAELRRELLGAATGRVLELGAGTGLNLAKYPPGLTDLVLSEPEPSMRARLLRRVTRDRTEATVAAAGAEAIPFPDDSFDTVVSTLVLCTVPDPAACVTEAKRVLRRGGRLLFIEHVRADSARLARRQDRFVRPWRGFAAGCHCNRSTLDLLRAHFPVVESRPTVWRGMPRIVQPLIVGWSGRE